MAITSISRNTGHMPSKYSKDFSMSNTKGNIGKGLLATSPVSLVLDFLYNKVLNNSITFARSDAVTCATYFDSTGRLQTKPVNYLLNSNDVTQAGWGNGGTATRPTSTTVNLPADGDFISQSYTSATVSAPYTVAVVLSGSGTVRVGKNSGTVTSDLVTLTSTPTLYVHNFTAGLTTIFALPAYRSGTTATTVTIGGAALFAGTYTAQQIIDLGGIPVTTTAANSGPRFDYDPASPAGVTGGELVTNGDFSQGFTGWSAIAGGWSIADGVATLTGNGAPQDLQQNVVTATGKTYLLSYNVISSTGTMLLTADGNTVASGSSGTISGYYRATGTSITLVAKRQSGTVNAVIDNVSVKEVTFNPRGLLIEESRKNNLLHSRDMTQAAWTKTDVTPARTQVGLDGVANTACLMTEGSAGTAWIGQDGAAVTAGSTLTFSVVLKRGNTDWVRVLTSASGRADGGSGWFNLATGAKGATAVNGAGSAVSSSITSLGGGWYRCSVSCVPNGSYTIPHGDVNSASADGSTTRVSGATYIVDCAQLEVGAFATSIIPTTTTALTRAVDSASMTGTNFSSWFSATEGTFVAEYMPGSADGFVFDANDGTANNRTRVFRASSPGTAFAVDSAGASQANITTSVAPRLESAKIAGAYAANDFAACQNGGTVFTDASGNVAVSTNRLDLGVRQGGTSAIGGWIRRLTYYPTRLPNATLQALTA